MIAPVAALFIVFLSHTAHAVEEIETSWYVSVNKDPFDDTIDVEAVAAGKSPRSAITLRCDQRELTLSFSVEGNGYLQDQYVRVKVRIDDGQIAEGDFKVDVFGDEPNSVTSLSSRPNIYTYRRLRSATKIAIRAIGDTDAPPLTYVYILSDTERALTPLYEACPMSSAAEG
jgi:hypothetical protein